MTVDVKDKQEIEITKTRKSFIKDAKEAINPSAKKRFRNPDDVNSTIRLSASLRKEIAEYCIKHDVSMNQFIITLIKKELEQEKLKKGELFANLQKQ